MRYILVIAFLTYILFGLVNQVGIYIKYPQCLFSSDPVMCKTIIESGARK